MIKQECIGIPDMILLLMIFCFKKIKIKAEIVLSPGGAYFVEWVIGSIKTSQRQRKLAASLLKLCKNNNYLFIYWQNLTRQSYLTFFESYGSNLTSCKSLRDR